MISGLITTFSVLIALLASMNAKARHRELKSLKLENSDLKTEIVELKEAVEAKDQLYLSISEDTPALLIGRLVYVISKKGELKKALLESIVAKRSNDTIVNGMYYTVYIYNEETDLYDGPVKVSRVFASIYDAKQILLDKKFKEIDEINQLDYGTN